MTTHRTPLFWVALLVLVVVLGLGLLYAYRAQTPAVPTVPVTQAVQEIQQGRVLEVVSSTPFPQAVRDAVLTPLGMDHTTFLPWEAAGHRVVTGHVDSDVVRGWPVGRARWVWARSPT